MKILIRSFFALLIILFVFWNRLIRIRTPGAITDVSLMSSIILYCFVLFNIYSIIVCLKQITNKTGYNGFIEKFLRNTIVLKFSKYLAIVVESPKFIYDYLADNFISFKRIVELPASYLAVYVWYPKIILFSLNFLPRVIISTAFLIDVTYFHYFYYFYKFLILLLLPILVSCYLHMISFHSNNSLEFVQQYINIIEHSDRIEFILKPEPPITEYALTQDEMKDKFHYMISLWRINTVLKQYTESLYETEKIYKPYVTLYVSTCFLIGCLYILFN
jgi:hypothetical protein